ncbi:MAG: family 10 glycosylhydrolase [Gemmatimonadetes bacterium]|nr:family 10 glycosylhydrolase [Gemmatimonadota bacterium]
MSLPITPSRPVHLAAARTVRHFSFMRRLALAAIVFAVACATGGGDGPTSPTTPTIPTTPTTPITPAPSADPPTISREFRGLWVATVANIDWPTKTGLTQAAAMAEMRVILDRAQSLRMNAVIVQVRAAGDALYRSPLEPWAKALTGTQGGDPGWDPLEAWVSEAHTRGLELHAWFNPYRAGNVSDTSRLAANHLAKARPDLARIAEGQLWFDPGEPEVQAQTLNVVTDVLSRYDIDGVHLDDYFYPYPLGVTPVFPDDASYARYLAAGGAAMARADWRRQNVNGFIQRLYAEVHRVKPTLKVGISPFGIWQPGYPAGVTGLNAFTDIFADSRTWLQNGWLDYLAPQLYWSTYDTGQNFIALFDWWLAMNTQKRHVWPGLAAYRVADGKTETYAASEILTEIAQTRARAGAAAGGASGALLYNTTSVRLNKGGLADALAASTYASAAVVPATPWLDATAPSAPGLTVTVQSNAMRALWTPSGTEAARWWLVQWRTATAWNARIVWGGDRSLDIGFTGSADRADVVVIAALDAAMNSSSATIWRATTR